MKHVYNNSELAHVWVHDWRRLGNGRNSTDSFYFQQNTIYSYGPHFPIARIVDMPNGDTVALFTTDTYGNTTAKHIGNTYSALQGNMPIYRVDNVKPNSEREHLGNWRGLRSELNAVRNRIRQAKTISDHDINYAVEKANHANEYAERFGITDRLEETEYPLIAYTEAERLRFTEKQRVNEIAAQAAADRAAANLAIETQKLNAARQARADKMARAQTIERLTFGLIKAPTTEYSRLSYGRPVVDDMEKAIRDWKRGKRSSLPYSYDGPVLLRVTDDKNVRTSMGVNIPMADCEAIWPEIRASHESQTETDNLKQRTIGVYRVQYLKNGDVKAGCHYVTYPEIRKLAIAMQWERATLGETLKYKFRKLAA